MASELRNLDPDRSAVLQSLCEAIVPGSERVGPVDRPEGYRLTGTKIWITNAPEADRYLVFASVDRSAGSISPNEVAPGRSTRRSANCGRNLSMGSSSWDIFRRIILPGTLPSVIVGATVGIGIAWAVVVAAEMISGGGSAGSMGGAKGGGLGFFIWNSYVGGSYTQIVVGMISIGIAGYISSALLRKLGDLVTPWLREQ